MTHMPPELLKSGKLAPAADMYAFGMVAWEVLSGAHRITMQENTHVHMHMHACTQTYIHVYMYALGMVAWEVLSGARRVGIRVCTHTHAQMDEPRHAC